MIQKRPQRLTPHKMNAISDALLRFLKDDTLKVAVIKGEWGVGKTFFWRNFLNTVKEELSFRAYSYVSLFGTQHITDLKRQLFANFEMLDQKSMSKHLEKLKPISTVLKSVKVPYTNSLGAINDLIESKIVENFLVCMDDIERKEDSVSGSSVLGFISQLKEEKSCKIIIIYNDQKLDEETKNQINEYREKVVDLELTYRPTIQENLSIIWPDDCPQCVSETFLTLNLNNIRVMQRVKWTLEYFSEEIAVNYPNLIDSFKAKCVLLTVIHHAYSRSVSLNEVLSTSYISLYLSKDEKDNERLEFLKKMQFIAEDQDTVIVEYLINGYVDFFNFHNPLASKNEQYRLSNINEQFRSIWSKYHSGFVVPQDEFIASAMSFLKKHVRDLRLSDVSSTVTFIRRLDPKCDLIALLNESIDLFVSQVDRSDGHDLQMLNLAPEVRSVIEEKLAAKTMQYSIRELFVALAGSDSWNPRDIKHLLKYSEEDFYEWIATEKSEDVVDLLKEFLQRFGTQNEDEKTIVARIQSALDKIKERSPIDRYRVEILIEKKHSG